MNAEQLKNMLANVDDDLPVLVKTADGWKRVSLAYEEILWDEKTVPGDELQAFCIELDTPEAELESFYLKSDELFFFIYFRTQQNYELVAKLDKKHYTLAEAFAERDYLNAEHRKKQA